MNKFSLKSVGLLLTALLICSSLSACKGTSFLGSNPNTSKGDGGLLGGTPDDKVSDNEKDKEYISEDEKWGRVAEGMLGNNGEIVKKDYDGYLGYGYNMITSPYYNHRSINDGHPVLDMAKLVAEDKVYVNNTSANFAEPKIYIHNSTKEYAEEMSAKAGLRGKFPLSGSFKVNFKIDSSYEMKSNQRLLTLQANLETRRDYVSGSSAKLLAQYLSDDFIDDVKDLSAENVANFVETYGTHILTNVTMGGRFDLNYLYTNKSTNEITNMEASLRASYRYISGSTDTSNKEDRKEVEENSSLQVRTYGGTVTVDPTTVQGALSSYKEWSQSVQNGMISFVDASEVFPIWDVIDELYKLQETDENKQQYAGKSDTVKKYCEDKASGEFNKFKKTVGVDIPKNYISDIYIGTGSSSDEAKNKLRSKGVLENNIVNLDLNHEAGGDWIYLGYKLTTKKSEGITYLVADFYGKKKSNDIKYNDWNMTIIPTDLNKGARGKYIYLYYTKNPKANDEPITAIKYQRDEQFEYGNGDGWEAVLCVDDGDPMDFNKGAGGSFIYLWYNRD